MLYYIEINFRIDNLIQVFLKFDCVKYKKQVLMLKQTNNFRQTNANTLRRVCIDCIVTKADLGESLSWTKVKDNYYSLIQSIKDISIMHNTNIPIKPKIDA